LTATSAYQSACCDLRMQHRGSLAFDTDDVGSIGPVHGGGNVSGLQMRRRFERRPKQKRPATRKQHCQTSFRFLFILHRPKLAFRPLRRKRIHSSGLWRHLVCPIKLQAKRLQGVQDLQSADALRLKSPLSDSRRWRENRHVQLVSSRLQNCMRQMPGRLPHPLVLLTLTRRSAAWVYATRFLVLAVSHLPTSLSKGCESIPTQWHSHKYHITPIRRPATR
jgi:hypothetical protein